MKHRNKDIKQNAKGLLLKMMKVDSLPKDVKSSIPISGILQNGVFETTPGIFTKTYHLDNANFTMLNEDDQMIFLKKYMDVLTTFDKDLQWQFTIFNHEIDKRKTLGDICIKPQTDGLNKNRKEMNEILISNLKHGNSSLTQDKYLTISLKDNNVNHALSTLNKEDAEISRRFKKLSNTDTNPLSLEERLNLFYNIYNQNHDYRLATGVFDGEEQLDLTFLAKCGLSFKDIIGPLTGFQFAKDYFMVGDKYAKAFYLKKPASVLSTNFLNDICSMQTNSLISMNYEQLDTDRAIKIVRNQVATIEGKVAETKAKNLENGYGDDLPPELEHKKEAARDLMNDITNRDQRLFFMTLTIVLFCDTKEQLESNTKILKAISSKHQSPIIPLKFQQEQGFNTALPLCSNKLTDCEIMYTTEDASIFVPYNAIETSQKNSVFYGLNQITKSMYLYNRTTGDNFNGLIFGSSGSGKSLAAKNEMEQILLSRPNDQIFVIDPQGEYTPMVKINKGLKVSFTPGAKTYINPLDLDISDSDDEDGGNPVAAKIDFITNMVKTIKKAPLTSTEEAVLAKAIGKIYDPYIKELEATGITINKSKCPTLTSLYQELMLQGRTITEAKQLCEYLSMFTVGQFDNFAHRTNVMTDNRLTCYNIKAVGTKMKELAYQICLNDIWNRMIENSKKGIYTWLYIDEFHILLESEAATLMLKRIWKMSRNWLGVPTGIMQNAADLIKNNDTMAIFNNTSFVIMLKGQLTDRNAFQQLLNLSTAQLEYITDSDVGHGLVYNGKMTTPFGLDFPRNTDLYKAMTTKHDVEGALFA